jgi:hypothetical protein
LSSPVFHLLQLEKEITRWCVLITVLYCPHCSDRWAPWKSTPIELGAASVSAACAAKGPQGYSHPLQSAGNGNQRTLTAVGYHPADRQKDRQGRHRQRQAALSLNECRQSCICNLKITVQCICRVDNMQGLNFHDNVCKCFTIQISDTVEFQRFRICSFASLETRSCLFVGPAGLHSSTDCMEYVDGCPYHTTSPPPAYFYPVRLEASAARRTESQPPGEGVAALNARRPSSIHRPAPCRSPLVSARDKQVIT